MTDNGRSPGYSIPEPGAATKLDSNENPYGVLDNVFERALEAARQLDPERYPDASATALRRELSNYTGLGQESLLVGNGADELIQLVLTFLRQRLRRIVLPVPTFGMYRFTAELLGLEVVEVPLDDDFDLDVEAILDAAEGEESALVLCTPNNPTGNCFSPEHMGMVIQQQAPFATVIVDEAYYEFCGESQIQRVAYDERIVVLRTLSKAFGLAGLRVGYLAAHPNTVSRLRQLKPPYNVSSFSQLAATMVLENRDRQLGTVRRLVADREVLLRALGRHPGLKPYPTVTNFVLVGVDPLVCGVTATELHKALRERGVSVRRYDGEPRLNDCIRISVGTTEDTAELARALAEVLRGKKGGKDDG